MESGLGGSKGKVHQSQDIPMSAARQMQQQKGVRDSDSRVQATTPPTSTTTLLPPLLTEEGESFVDDRYSLPHSSDMQQSSSPVDDACRPQQQLLLLLSTSPEQQQKNELTTSVTSKQQQHPSKGLQQVRLNDSQDSQSLTSSAAVLNRQSSGGGLRVAVRPTRAMAIDRGWQNGGKDSKYAAPPIGALGSGGNPLKRTPVLHKEQTYSAVVLGMMRLC
jgi:hypothetical protein